MGKAMGDIAPKGRTAGAKFAIGFIALSAPCSNPAIEPGTPANIATGLNEGWLE